MVQRDWFIAVYMMSNRKHGTLYIGVSGSLLNRVLDHREALAGGFTKKHGLNRLVWYEPHDCMTGAIQRETSLKKYRREWKINLIERDNPHWDDLFLSVVRSAGFSWVAGTEAGHDDPEGLGEPGAKLRG